MLAGLLQIVTCTFCNSYFNIFNDLLIGFARKTIVTPPLSGSVSRSASRRRKCGSIW